MNFAPNPQRLFIRTAHRMDVRPHVVINAAMSVDGKIALSGGKPVRLSNEEDLRRVHALRAKADAVLVGIGTVLKDDPKLTVKAEYVKGRNPLRIVLDSRGRTPAGANVLDRSAPTLIVTAEASQRHFSEVEVLRIGKDEVDLESLLDRLAARGIRLLLVEGGSTVIGSFLRRGLADELKVFVGSEGLGGLLGPAPRGRRGGNPARRGRRVALDPAG